MGGRICGSEGIINVADLSFVMEPQVFITLYFIIYIYVTAFLYIKYYILIF